MIGSGLAGLSAALTAHERGLDVVVLEKGEQFGGATANSGGQVWIGGNHVARREGLDDSVDDAIAYVEHLARESPSLIAREATREWLDAAVEAARWFEDIGAIEWQLIPDYPDYYYPDAPGSRPTGRYLTGAPMPIDALGDARPRLIDAPHFPVGITYAEMFAWGGMSSRDRWDMTLVERRRRAGILTFGRGIAASFAAAVLERGVPIRTSHAVTALLTDAHGRVTGVSCDAPEGPVEIAAAAVILATGAHDWSAELSERFTDVPAEHGGSVAPPTVAGDAFGLASTVGAATIQFPSWAAPIIPGYRLPEPEWPGDTRYRTCFEHCLPHTFVVNRGGRRFCDDSFHPALVRAAVGAGPDGDGNLPMFMVWDEQHHQRYGLGRTAPGAPYSDGLVASAPSLDELAGRLGVDAGGLVETAAMFNRGAAEGLDPRFGRGSNLSVRRFRGDANAPLHPNVGPVDQPPFFGMPLRLLNTGIAAAGLATTTAGRVVDERRRPIANLYAAGECAARISAGVGYNSGYSLSRAMTYGYLAATDVAARHVAGGS